MSSGMSESTPVKIIHANEQWSEYLVENGTLVRVRLKVTAIHRQGDAYFCEGHSEFEATPMEALFDKSIKNNQEGG